MFSEREQNERKKKVPEAQAVNINHSRQSLIAKGVQPSRSDKTGLGKQKKPQINKLKVDLGTSEGNASRLSGCVTPYKL